jgi:selenocysteine lyase/cysteine desulfurase
MVYLNTAAEGIPPVEVGAALGDYFRDKALGMDGRERHLARWGEVRELAAGLFGLEAEEVALCSCTSEAYNLAARAVQLRDGDEVVINDLDFPAGVTPWLLGDCPARARLWRSRDGRLAVEDLAGLLGPRTRLVNTSLVSFWNGYRVPLAEVAAVVRRHSPALLAVDVTQALGRIPLGRELADADLVVGSTHKWLLASHGGGIVGVPRRRAAEWTVPAGGWFNLDDAFGPGRFEAAAVRPGAPGFMVGMPNFPAVYAVRAALAYLCGVGVVAVAAAADPLVRSCLDGLARLPVELISPRDPGELAGILAFRHPRAESIHRRLHEEGVHLMHHAGRLRVAWHGYNTREDVDRFLHALAAALREAP